jgi:hypothetical protein
MLQSTIPNPAARKRMPSQLQGDPDFRRDRLRTTPIRARSPEVGPRRSGIRRPPARQDLLPRRVYPPFRAVLWSSGY